MNPDLFIAGGGPAGLATAIVAARSGQTAVVSDTGHSPIDKAGGEGLLPDALEALPYLGVDLFFVRSFPLHGIRFVMAFASASSAPLFTLSFSVMLKQPMSVSSGTQPSVASRQTPLLRLSMIETRNQLDMFSEKGITNAPPGPRLPI